MEVLSNLKDYKILLASASPRRKELLAQLHLAFEVAHLIEIEESYPSTLLVDEIAPYLSKLKADAYKKTIKDNELIITADTVVINAGCVMGKPSSVSEARNMLKLLSKNTHNVITGVTITTINKQVTFAVDTQVEFAQLKDEEIDWYIEKFSPMDKAGAYGIQEWIGCIGVKNINGSFYNVMGLPLHRLYDELRRF